MNSASTYRSLFGWEDRVENGVVYDPRVDFKPIVQPVVDALRAKLYEQTVSFRKPFRPDRPAPLKNPMGPTMRRDVMQPLVQDTLLPLVGQNIHGSPRFTERSNLPGYGHGLGETTAQYFDKGWDDEHKHGDGIAVGAAYNKDWANTPQPDEERRRVMMHEFGHAFDFRKIAPQLRAAVGKRFGQAEAAGGYQATSPSEHFAEAFQNSVDVLSSLKDLLQDPSTRYAKLTPKQRKEFFDDYVSSEDKWRPGTKEIVDYLLRQPTYAKHPFAIKDVPKAKKPAASPR